VIRVLQILPDLDAGGAQRMAANLALTLDRSKFEVLVACLYGPSGTDLEGELARGGIPVRHLGKRPGLDRRLFGEVSRLLRAFRPEAVHTHQYVLRYVLPALVRHRTPVRLHTIHNVAEKEVDRAGRIVHHAAFRLGVIPVAIAQEVADSLRRVYGVEGAPLIPNGIPVERYACPAVMRDEWRAREGFGPDAVLFVCVGRLSRQKNPALLLDAFALGPASNPRSRLLFVGDGELRGEMEARASSLGLRERVRFLGVRTDVPEILGAADIFVLPSDWEGNPLSVMEAMAAGKPAVCTAVGGVPELVEDGVTGLLVQPGDEGALAAALIDLATDDRARTEIARVAARRAAEHFGIETMARSYERLYETGGNGLRVGHAATSRTFRGTAEPAGAVASGRVGVRR
jgi:glycosyltransferase involved in cell wall biosynthesis